MSDRSLVISLAAKDDLTAIYRVGEQTWGQSQSVKYLRRLREQFWSLTQRRLSGYGAREPDLSQRPLCRRA